MADTGTDADRRRSPWGQHRCMDGHVSVPPQDEAYQIHAGDSGDFGSAACSGGLARCISKNPDIRPGFTVYRDVINMNVVTTVLRPRMTSRTMVPAQEK